MTRIGLPPCPYGLRPVSRLALAALIAAAAAWTLWSVG